MATATMTVPPPLQQRRPGKSKLPPENERFMQACSDIANVLIQDHEAQRNSAKPKKDINLNKLQKDISKKYSLANSPPLTAIIAAVPEHYKKYILPRLIAKPIRMYSYLLIAPTTISSV